MNALIFVPSSSQGIVVNAGASDYVALVGLTIEGIVDTTFNGQVGIRINSAKSVLISNCVISGTSEGIFIDENYTSAASIVSNKIFGNARSMVNFATETGNTNNVSIGNNVIAANSDGFYGSFNGYQDNYTEGSGSSIGPLNPLSKK